MKIELGDGKCEVKKGDTLYAFDKICMEAVPCTFVNKSDVWVRVQFDRNSFSTLSCGTEGWFSDVPSMFFKSHDYCINEQIKVLLRKKNEFRRVDANKVLTGEG